MERDFETFVNQYNRLKESEISKGSNRIYDLEKYFVWSFKNESKFVRIPDVPELEVSVEKHRFEDEVDTPYVRQRVLELSEYFPQDGNTCGLTAFMLVLGALGKRVPTYEEVMGVDASEISGSFESDHSRFINCSSEYSDIKETRVVVRGVEKHKEQARQAIFDLLGEGQYLYVLVNWQKLHGRGHPDDRRDYDHAIVLHGARETAAPIQKDKINYLVTDPNHHRYHNIWIPESLLFRSFTMESAHISAYTLSQMTLRQRMMKNFTGERPVRCLQI